MLVGLLSDTHGYLHPRIPALFTDVAHILHAGDVGSEAVLTALWSVAPLTAVRGNVDLELAGLLPARADLALGGIGIHLVHRPEDALPPPSTRVVVYGHTHRPLVERRQGILYVNPGAAGRQGFHQSPTVALLRISGDRVDAEIVTLNPLGGS